MKILVIDDRKIYPKVEQKNLVTYARTSEVAMEANLGSYDEIWFDHDLGGSDDTRRVATKLAGLHFKSVAVRLITDNPWGHKWLGATLSEYRIYPPPAGARFLEPETQSQSS